MELPVHYPLAGRFSVTDLQWVTVTSRGETVKKARIPVHRIEDFRLGEQLRGRSEFYKRTSYHISQEELLKKKQPYRQDLVQSRTLYW